MSFQSEENEPLSFAPVTIKRPLDPAPHKTPKLVGDVIRKLLQPKLFVNLLYSLSEVKLLKGKKLDATVTTARVVSLMQEFSKSGSDKTGILQQLNGMVVFAKSLDETLKVFEVAKLQEMLGTWLAGDLTEEQRMYVLNLLCVCVNFIGKSHVGYGYLFKSVGESLEGVRGSVTKKSVLLLLALAARMANIEEVKDEVLAYTYQQLFVVSSSFDNPLNFQFILRGEIPRAYSDGEKVLKNRTLDKELMTYWAKGEFTSETQCPEVRRFLSEMSECLPALVAALSASMEANFRLFNPNSEFPLVCQAPGADDAFVNSDKIREKDIVVLATWSFVYVLSAALRRSSMMDAELFKYLIVAGGRKSMPGTLFASLSGDIKSVIVPSPSEQYSALGPVGKKLNIMAAAVAVGMHVTATLVTYWPIVTQSYINDKNVKAVMLVESVESKILHREAAYLLSHFMRWMGRNPSIGRVMRFIYMNLEQFEMFTRWNSEMTTDLISQRTEAQHIESLEKHAAAAELKITIAKKSK